jgi:hypothetical protein
MLRRIPFIIAPIGLLMLDQAGNASAPVPPNHWFISSQTPEGARDYVGSADHTTVYSGSASGVLASVTSNPNVSGTLMQRASAAAYAGKTVVFSAFLKGKELSGSAGLWFRADAANGLVVAFKNAWSRSQLSRILRGSTEWRKAELVITVPSSAVALAYGVQMKGGGTVWIDHVRIEARPTEDQIAEGTSRTVTYNPPPQLETLSEPANLDFEE